MAHSARARKPYTCGKGGEAINVGDRYLWFKHRHGSKQVRCVAHPFLRSELTLSPNLSTIYAAQENVAAEIALADYDEPGTLNNIADALDSAGESMNEAGEAYEESGQNIEDGFGHETEQSTELKERKESLDGTATEYENAAQAVRHAAEGLETAIATLQEALPDEDPLVLSQIAVDDLSEAGRVLYDEVEQAQDDAASAVEEAEGIEAEF